jgi:hypothetical protein
MLKSDDAQIPKPAEFYRFNKCYHCVHKLLFIFRITANLLKKNGQDLLSLTQQLIPKPKT